MTARAWTSRSARLAACGAVLALSGVASAAAQSPAATPYDVSLFKWARTEDAPGFDRQPLFQELVVGPDGRVLLMGAIRQDDLLTPVVWGSDDGRTWAQLAGDMPPGSVALDAAVAGDGFVILSSSDVTSEGRLSRSDGSTIEPLEGPTGDLSAIEGSRVGLHVLDGTAQPTVWTSTDAGATWEPTVITEEDALVRRLVATDDGTLVAAGTIHQGEDQEAPTAWTSGDGGATWHASTLPLGSGTWLIADLAFTPIGLVVRVIDALDDASDVNLVSPDGETWTPIVETTGWGSIGTAGPEALIFGEDAAWHSADGKTWTEEWWPTLAGFDIVASRPMPGGPVVAAGIARTAPGSGATFVGAPAPQPVASAPIDLVSPAP